MSVPAGTHALGDLTWLLTLYKVFRCCRINADRNDLAWQFTMDVYPAITFFPAFR